PSAGRGAAPMRITGEREVFRPPKCPAPVPRVPNAPSGTEATRPPGAVPRTATPEIAPPAMRAPEPAISAPRLSAVLRPDDGAVGGAWTDESAMAWGAERAGEQQSSCGVQLGCGQTPACASWLDCKQRSLCEAQPVCEAKSAFAKSLASTAQCVTQLAREAG